MHVRPGTASDSNALAALFTAAVHELTACDYDAAQRAAWAPRPPHVETWRQRLAPLQLWVAEHNAAATGFIAYTLDGYIDLLFTAPPWVRRGVASRLYRHAESTLCSNGVRQLSTHASRVARPFFAHHGFHTTARQQVQVRGVPLPRFAMCKRVPHSSRHVP